VSERNNLTEKNSGKKNKSDGGSGRVTFHRGTRQKVRAKEEWGKRQRVVDKNIAERKVKRERGLELQWTATRAGTGRGCRRRPWGLEGEEHIANVHGWRLKIHVLRPSAEIEGEDWGGNNQTCTTRKT